MDFVLCSQTRHLLALGAQIVCRAFVLSKCNNELSRYTQLM